MNVERGTYSVRESSETISYRWRVIFDDDLLTKTLDKIHRHSTSINLVPGWAAPAIFDFWKKQGQRIPFPKEVLFVSLKDFGDFISQGRPAFCRCLPLCI